MTSSESNAGAGAGQELNHGQREEDFEPEYGSFGISPLYASELRLHEALFEGDTYRSCQLVAVPAFTPEWAVYLLTPEQGSAVVVTRKLHVSLHNLMFSELLLQAGKSKAPEMGLTEQAAALAKIRASTETARAEIDRRTAELSSRACEAVLKRTHHQGRGPDPDSTSYHAGHWQPGSFIAGHASSPRAGTIVGDYVALGEALRAYATSGAKNRPALEAELRAKADALLARAERKR